MQPSSFVFVAIVALWAAYLLPQWIRRRDTLGASRGADRFSAGLRVLARRRRPSTPARSTSPLLQSVPVPAEPDLVEIEAVEVSAPLAPGRRRAALPAAELAARRRRAVLSGLAALTVLTTVGALAGVVPGVAVTTSLVLLLLDLGALRAVAVREQQRRAEGARAARVARPARTSARVVEAPDAGAGAVPDAAPQDVVLLAGEADVVDEVPDAEAPAAGNTWVPVPVPPPTYTLKPVAPRPEPAPLEPSETPAAHGAQPGHDAPDVDEPAAQVDLDSVLERRRAVNG